MKEVASPVITAVGKIDGRDAIYLDKVNFINEQTFELLGGFNGSLCENLADGQESKFSITFHEVLSFQMMELDFDESSFESSFDCIENSKRLQQLLRLDIENDIHKMDDSYRHLVFRTYDTVFEIIGKGFDLVLK